MDMTDSNDSDSSPLRILVAIASYGTSNDRYLEQIIGEYRSMAFDVDIVLLSNLDKTLGRGIECRVGLPAKDPWSLPFGHKQLFADRCDQYDLFIYSEDDILITERTLRAWLEVTAELQDDEIAGFLRVEFGADGARNYPDVHAHFHWDASSVRTRGDFTLAHFTNEHAACYVLSRAQLRKAINSGGFAVEPHEGKYDLLCTAATDPYTQCGLTKLIPVSRLEDFTVHHMSNKYVGKMGLSGAQFLKQLAELRRIANESELPRSLVPTETKLWRSTFSKDYYEPASEQVAALIPETVRNVLSVGCGWGAMEHSLVVRGMAVTAIPLDPVICRSAAESGVEIVPGDFEAARANLAGRRFDCMLALNILHLAPDPAGMLALLAGLLAPEAPIIIRSPNMPNLPAVWRQLRNRRLEVPRSYRADGAHFSSRASVEKWCAGAGLNLEQTIGVLHQRAEVVDGIAPEFARIALSTDLISVALAPP